MRCRKAASYAAFVFTGSTQLLLVCIFVLLPVSSTIGLWTVQGVDSRRSLAQANNLVRNSVYNTTVRNADEFYKALLKQNIALIFLANDINLNRTLWEKGTDDNPKTGIIIRRNLRISTTPDLQEVALLYLDYMSNRVIVSTGVTVLIDGVSLRGVSSSPYDFIHLIFLYSEDDGTIQIRNSQMEIAFDPDGEKNLTHYANDIRTSGRPENYENEEISVRVLPPEVCGNISVRGAPCPLGGLFIKFSASRITFFNASQKPVAKAAYIADNVLMVAVDVGTMPTSYHYTVQNVSTANEMRIALQNPNVETIYIKRDINMTEGMFNPKTQKMINIQRNLSISTDPDRASIATLQFNYIREAAQLSSGVRLRLSRLNLTRVTNDFKDHERVPFFCSLHGSSQIFQDVVSELVLQANARNRKTLNKLPFALYGADIDGSDGNNAQIVTIKDTEWCKKDGQISCPNGAMLILRGKRRIRTSASDPAAFWTLNMFNVLINAIDPESINVPPPKPAPVSEPFATSISASGEERVSREDDKINSHHDSASEDLESDSKSKSGRIDPWILIYLLVAMAIVMCVTLLLVTVYKKREESKEIASSNKKETRSDFSIPVDDDGFREYQAIARQLLGDVKLGVLLGCGSFGRVYKATWSGAQVAVKVILHQEDEEEVTQEARFSLSLRHPNVVQTYHYAVRSLEICPSPAKEERQQQKEVKDKSENEFVNSAPAVTARHHGMNIPSSWEKASGSAQSADRSGPITTETMKSTHTAMEASTAGGASHYEEEEEEEDDECWMEMWLIQEYCELGSVGRQNNLRLNSQNSVLGGRRGDISAIIDTCRDVARGMKYLHDNGIVHGDLKCDNLLLQSCQGSPKGFSAKVADFGLSRKLGCVTHLSTKSFGTITHMPPELLLEGHLSPKVDVYSFGVIMWELWTGDSPFRNMRYAEVMRAIVVDDRRPEFEADTSIEYVNLATKCWDKEPYSRPTFEEVLVELDELAKVLPYDDGDTTDSSHGRVALVPSDKVAKS